MRNKIVPFFLLSLVFVLVFIFLVVIDRKPLDSELDIEAVNNTNEPIEDSNLTIDQINSFDLHKFTYSGWVPSWGSSSGLDSLKRNNSFLNSISPVWYELNENGSLKTRYPSQRQEIIAIAKENSIEIIPAIAMFDHELFTKVLQSQANLERHVEEIVNTVTINQYDGIDLDYESTKLSDKEKYFEMLSKLSSKLHENEKKLIVTVIAKWGDDIVYPSLVETRQVQDWTQISKLADEIRIMAYDYTFTRSRNPGPIGPINWIEEVLKYAVTKVEPSKLILGVHLYSYEWKGNTTQPLTFIPNYMGNTNGTSDASSYVYSQVKSILKENSGKSSDFEGEKIFEYKKEGIYRSLVYIDPQGIKERVELASKYKLGGVVFWRLGGEDELLTSLYNAD
jgi:spore germination protein YaaH